MPLLCSAAWVAALGLVGCKDASRPQAPPVGVSQAAEAEPPAPPVSAAARTCQSASFARSTDLPEASGAVWVPASFGLPAHVVIVADSGHDGQFAIVDAESGESLAAGRLPLDGTAGDDLEGLTRAGSRYLAITSSGFIAQFRRTGASSFEPARPSYGLGSSVQCANPRSSNCQYDFEGLCVADGEASGPCHGYAASRSKGQLVCLRWADDDRLVADPERVIDLGWTGRLAGCAIVPHSDRLLAAANLLGKNQLVEIAGWRAPDSSRIHSLGWVGMGFGEAVAADPDGSIYRFSDTGGQPSLMGRYMCAESDL